MSVSSVAEGQQTTAACGSSGANHSKSTVVIDTQHQDVVHDTQFDYYGQLVASASSDGTVKIFSVQSQNLVATLTGHEGPVWMISWAHPRFGAVIASASFDRRVIVWKDAGSGSWRPVHFITVHTSSVNAVQWAPQEYGSILASAGSDGAVAVTKCTAGAWSEPVMGKTRAGTSAHPLGATGVSFAPYHAFAADYCLLASSGCDGKVCVWKVATGDTNSVLTVSPVAELPLHKKDWVRDVAFNPDASSSFITIASCGEMSVVIARKARDGFLDDAVSQMEGWDISVTPIAGQAWRLSWSPCGTMLLVTTDTNEVFTLTEGSTFTDNWLIAPVQYE
mmetsp:Transcript_71534/g.83217  ORF Transcript_71534/g.83217 Transcript_71534/m.83217 type:complete len:335 (+) Transcript_71534:101-1105(+)|eukprot:CAMPEP_0176433374 /NCGR_PEP_ID=MMETSP0127-20121128/15981_1 /TAXON_ID=938130 /ORGANISM="Platyophrya macrostoma, Strain WH" /LENGTH=334 /DNA_ID=CAMNT_0017815783 /DNA_START=93 /DNA_END=1097 /DNA_ORIENTATION=-